MGQFHFRKSAGHRKHSEPDPTEKRDSHVGVGHHIFCEESEHVGGQIHGENTVVHEVVIVREIGNAS